jgi:tetratricopeptide (TPR) repeat protein
MKNSIYICAVLVVLLQAGALAQKTEVSVQKGLVKAQTAAGIATVDAGRKAVLTQDKEPVIGIDDPMVDDLIKMYKWIEEEKKSGIEQIDVSSIQIKRIDSEQLLATANLHEIPNMKLEPSDTVRIGLTSILNQPRYYDLEGNLLRFDLDKVNKRQGYYYLHFPKTVEPGEKFKFVGVSKFNASKREIWKEGPLWHIMQANCTPNCLNYFRTVLPESAVFVESSRPVTIIDSVRGQVVVTIRNYTGPWADGMYQISFLWPDKDGTTLADLPAQYRGLQDKVTADLAEEYRRQMQRILAGEAFNDLSTPLNALLTNNCAIVNKDKDLYIETTYLCKIDPERAQERRKQSDEQFGGITRYYFIDELDFLSTPDWPKEPENLYIHPIYMCRKGSKMRADTLACIYEDGRWYRFGNMGDGRDTDVSGFKEWLPGYEEQGEAQEPALDNLPWDGAGPEALEVYQEFVDENVEYVGQWQTLGIKLVGSGFWEQAFDCFQRCEKLLSHKESAEWLTASIWQGHIYDVWGQRDQALVKYEAALDVLQQYRVNNAALDIVNYSWVRHDQWGIVLSYKWIKERMEEPFTKEMIGK